MAETSVPPEMSAWARQFEDTLSKLKNEMKKDVATWTLSSAPAHLTTKVILTISELDQVATSMAVQVKAIEYRIAQRHKAEKAITRKEQTERARLLAPWRNSAVPADERVPVCYLRFMLECGLLVQ